MATESIIKPAGLFTDPNPLSSAPRGALKEALNVVIRRDGTVDPRPGFRAVDPTGSQSVAGTPYRLIPWLTDLLYITSSGSWIVDAVTAAVITPGAAGITGLAYGTLGSGWAAKSAEARGSLYLTTTSGLKKITSRTATASEAVGLSGRRSIIYYAFPTGGGTGFCPLGHQVAYRATFQRRNANQLVVTSSPTTRTTGRATAANDGFNLKVGLDTEVVAAGDVLQLWRSLSDSAVADDKLFLLAETVISAAQITAREVTYTDIVADTSLGAELYTNDSMEGIEQANDPPPRVRDLANFRGSLFGADIDGRKSVILSWQRDAAAVSGDATKIGLRVATATTASGANTLTAITDNTGWTVGAIIQGTGIPEGTRIASVGVGVATMSANATATAAVVVGVTDTLQFDGDYFIMGSPAHLAIAVNVGTLGTTKYSSSGARSTNYRATVLTDIDSASVTGVSTASVLIEAIDPSFATALGVNATKPTQISPELTAIATAHSADAAYVSSNDIIHGLIYSKKDQPEHFPGGLGTLNGNIDRVGSSSFRIDRIIATRDALWVFKRDGIYRLTGAGAESGWRIDPFDMTHYLIATDSVVVIDDTIFAWTNRGVVKISDAGIVQISALAIGNLLSDQERAQFATPYNSYASSVISMGWATADLKSDEYWLCVGVPGEVPTWTVYVFNTKTEAWTRWTMRSTPYHAVVDGNGRAVFAVKQDSTNDPVMDYERIASELSSDASIYSDHSFSSSCTTELDDDGVTWEVTLSGAVTGYTPTRGDYVVSGGVVGRISEAFSSTRFAIVGDSFEDVISVALYEGYNCGIQFVTKIAGSAGTEKMWRDGSIVFASVDNMNEYVTYFTSSLDQQPVGAYNDVDGFPDNNEVLPWLAPFWVPRNFARASMLLPAISWRQAYAHPTIYGINLTNASFSPMVRR